MSDKKTAILQFHPLLNELTKKKELRHGLSVAVQIGNTLWITNDETVSLERLTFKGEDEQSNLLYGDHQQFPLNEYLNLPAPPDPDNIDDCDEADIEGLDYHDGYLWLVGSHSLKRGKADKKASVQDNLQSLASISSDGNRYLLARIPVVKEGDTYTLKKKTTDEGVNRTAAQLKGSTKTNGLIKWLKKDEHLKEFFGMPGKDNGFDIEGLAFADDSIFLGLRGPVLRGWAIILEIALKKDSKKNPEVLRIKSVMKHFLQLDGLGIRDLVIQGTDVLVLAGPTMVLDGPVSVYRWKNGVAAREQKIVFREELEIVMEIPFGKGDDHAEGISLFSINGGKQDSILVVYDSAAENRHYGETGVRADIFPIKEISSQSEGEERQDSH